MEYPSQAYCRLAKAMLKFYLYKLLIVQDIAMDYAPGPPNVHTILIHITIISRIILAY